MSRHVIGPVDALGPGTRQRVEINGRGIVVFNVRGAFYALRDTCPHQGAKLSAGVVVGAVDAQLPGCYDYDPGRPFVKCPWHGWEFELATGQSWCEPERLRVRSYEVSVEPGAAIVPTEADPESPVPGQVRGPYVAETYPATLEGRYVVVDLGARG